MIINKVSHVFLRVPPSHYQKATHSIHLSNLLPYVLYCISVEFMIFKYNFVTYCNMNDVKCFKASCSYDDFVKKYMTE